MKHTVFFVPGMFGFGRLAGYDYFQHLGRALEPHFARRGHTVEFHDVPSPPTSSLRERARVLARTVAHTVKDEECIHVVGHSTGGLDARLALSPGAQFGLPPDQREALGRVRSLVTLNTPHYGTPLASYFATVSGTRLLYALSLLTVVSLKLGEPSLSVFSRVLAGLGGLDNLLGGDLKLFSRVTSGILRFIDRDGRSEITEYLSKVQTDQGAVIQISPESMDLFNAAVQNAPSVRYGSIAAASPRPSSLRAARGIRSAYMAFTAALYSTLYQFTAERHERYGYATPTTPEKFQFKDALGYEPTDGDSDGIVPTMSMPWGELIWVTEGDHLDTLGHFHDDREPPLHTDWLTSGARMTRQEFERMVGRIAEFLLGPKPAHDG